MCISGNSARTAGPIGTGEAPIDAPKRRNDIGAGRGSAGGTWHVASSLGLPVTRREKISLSCTRTHEESSISACLIVYICGQSTSRRTAVSSVLVIQVTDLFSGRRPLVGPLIETRGSAGIGRPARYYTCNPGDLEDLALTLAVVFRITTGRKSRGWD